MSGNTHQTRSGAGAALRIVLVYAVFASLWILLSDKAVAWLFRDPEVMTQVSMLKGWLFVAFTALLLFGLIQRLAEGLQSALDTVQQREKDLQDSQDLLLEAQHIAGLGSYTLDVASGQWTSSEECDQVLGIDAHYGRSVQGWADLIHPDERDAMSDYFRDDVLKRGHNFDREYRIVRPRDGAQRWVHGLGHLEFDALGRLQSMRGTIQDVTDKKQAAVAVEAARSQLQATLDALPDLLFEVGQDGRIFDYHSHRGDLLAASPDVFLGRTFADVLPADVAQICALAIGEAAEKGFSNGRTYSLHLPQGPRWFDLSVAPMHVSAGQSPRFILIARDITTIKEHQDQLEHIAHFDPLTNLPNRLLLADRLQQAMNQAHRRGQQLAVAYLDLDGFKRVNDQHGHDVGDELLIALAQRMKETLRDGDTLARMGGDEFVAVLIDLDSVEASLPLLTRLLAAAAEPVRLGERVLQVSGSVGVTLYPQAQDMDADQLLRQADQAMYQAKLAGKNRYHVFDAEQDSSIRGHHESLEHMRQAMVHGEFVLVYQPKVNMRSGKVIGAEALIRWQHPQRGLLSPAGFLPVIEDHAMAVALGEWVIDTALRQVERWRDAGLDIPVSVNVGARQLQQLDFVARLRAILAAHPQVQPSCLELEILETSALKDMAQVSQVIDACERIGVSFALDDFGTGYSSLTYLKRLRVTLLKIDQSFVRDMLDDPDDLAILEGVIGLARAFHRAVIAEGVETVEHGTRLLQLGCEQVQGYGIARPMPGDALPAWAAAWRPDPAWSGVKTTGR